MSLSHLILKVRIKCCLFPAALSFLRRQPLWDCQSNAPAVSPLSPRWICVLLSVFLCHGNTWSGIFYSQFKVSWSSCLFDFFFSPFCIYEGRGFAERASTFSAPLCLAVYNIHTWKHPSISKLNCRLQCISSLPCVCVCVSVHACVCVLALQSLIKVLRGRGRARMWFREAPWRVTFIPPNTHAHTHGHIQKLSCWTPPTTSAGFLVV